MSKYSLGTHNGTNEILEAIKKGSSKTKKLQMNFPEELHRQFKMACAADETEMTEVCVKLVREWLDARENKIK